jgi:WD40 repeat protein
VLATLSEGASVVTALHWSDDGSVLVSGSWDGTVRIGRSGPWR